MTTLDQVVFLLDCDWAILEELLVRRGDKLFAIGAICTHYGAPLAMPVWLKRAHERGRREGCYYVPVQ